MTVKRFLKIFFKGADLRLVLGTMETQTIGFSGVVTERWAFGVIRQVERHDYSRPAPEQL